MKCSPWVLLCTCAVILTGCGDGSSSAVREEASADSVTAAETTVLTEQTAAQTSISQNGIAGTAERAEESAAETVSQTNTESAIGTEATQRQTEIQAIPLTGISSASDSPPADTTATNTEPAQPQTSTEETRIRFPRISLN